MEITMPEIKMPEIKMPDLHVSEFKKVAAHTAMLAANFVSDEIARARAFDPARMVGYQRRPSVLGRVLGAVGLVAAGAVVGVGVALLVSPDAAKTRADLKRRLTELFGPGSPRDAAPANGVKPAASAHVEPAHVEPARADAHAEDHATNGLTNGHGGRAPRAPMPTKTSDKDT